jgi:glycerol-3-phosphate O-acyltransferase
MSTSLQTVAETENRLARFNDERSAILSAVEQRVLDRLHQAAQSGEEHSLEYVLNEVAFNEIRRHENEKSRKAHTALARWRDLSLRLGRMSPEEKRHEVAALVAYYARDIVGNFNPRVYRFANSVIPSALSFLLAPVGSVRDGLAALGNMEGQVHVEGPLDLIRATCERGTLVFTPTHSSNLDSVVIGFGLTRAGLPPVTYGAGKNLFSNPFISYFMYNLGAYRVDRRLQFSLYKEVLKEYSTVLLERGYHSLFFPGGTRSRSNMVEKKLKLGLLGTAMTAYRNSVANGSHPRRIYVIPVTINYRLVLEAETLIEDYLAETGRSRYIIEDDEFSRIGRIIEFLRKLMAHDSAVLLRFGRPLDIFGNETDDAGESLDPRGRHVDPKSYLLGRDGQVVEDSQREAVYTRGLGEALVRSFRKNTIFSSTPLVCRAVWDALTARTGIRDIYRLMRLPTTAASVERVEVCRRIDDLCRYLREAPQFGKVADGLTERCGEEILDDALEVLGKYHTRPVLLSDGDRVRVGYMKLLYYYRNRTDHVEMPS